MIAGTDEQAARDSANAAMLRAILIESGRLTKEQIDALDRESERTKREGVTGATMGQAVAKYLAPGGKLEHLFSGEFGKSTALITSLMELPIDEAVQMANELAYTAQLLKDTANVILASVLSKRP